MKSRLTEINIVPIKPQNGLVGFVSFVLNDCWYMGSIGIVTRSEGGYRLVYPTKKVGERSINIFHPINKETSQEIENVVIKHFEEVINHDRYDSVSFTK